MPGPTDLLFGKIAVEQGYVSEADLEECIADQINAQDSRPLGEMLLERSTITRRQMEAILAIQQERLEKEHPKSRQRRADTLFGRLAWRMGMLTQDDLHSALRLQAAMDDDKVLPLGELLVREGYLTDRQVQSILEVQRKAILYCSLCRVLYALKGLASKDALESLRSLTCARCREPLKEPGDDVPEDAEWVLLPLEGLPVRAPSTSAPTPPSTRRPTRHLDGRGKTPPVMPAPRRSARSTDVDVPSPAAGTPVGPTAQQGPGAQPQSPVPEVKAPGKSAAPTPPAKAATTTPPIAASQVRFPTPPGKAATMPPPVAASQPKSPTPPAKPAPPRNPALSPPSAPVQAIEQDPADVEPPAKSELPADEPTMIDSVPLVSPDGSVASGDGDAPADAPADPPTVVDAIPVDTVDPSALPAAERPRPQPRPVEDEAYAPMDGMAEVAEALAASAGDPDSPAPPKPIPRDCVCPICEAEFPAVPDKFERVKCPKCRTYSIAI